MKRKSDPIKDDETAHPIAHAWRATFRAIVNAFAAGDYTREIQGVNPIRPATTNQIQKYVAHYGEKIAELPDETWSTSVSQWMGTHWDVLVDLWTVESEQSDLVLFARVFEIEGGFRIEIDSVHVP
jgi:hypothetical protein